MSWTAEVLDTIAAEFSDVGDVAQLTRIVVRLMLAAVLGFMLGFEREQHGKAAGVRTHMLVAIGSALFVLIPQQTGIVPADMSRVDTEVNHLNNQVLVRYYESEWHDVSQ